MPRILSGDEIDLLVRKVIDADSGEQKQPAGFDVTVNNIHSFPQTRFTLGIAKGENSTLEDVPLVNGSYYDLEAGAYFVEPERDPPLFLQTLLDLLPRSTLLRNGLDVRTVLLIPGYSGQPKVMLVCHRPARIQKFSRIGQAHNFEI